VSLRVVFRTDASTTIGTGHVMRCLTLARELAARGHSCHFVSRDLAGHLGAKVTDEGFGLTLLVSPSMPFSQSRGFMPGVGVSEESPQGLEERPFGATSHASWAEVPWEQDAEETRAASRGADWLVLDHYAFDAAWEANALPEGARLMVIDDLADRPHQADLLLDQNLGCRRADYDTLLPWGSERLIGPRHALLRPAFAASRADALRARADRGFHLSHVLVSMGGVDIPNATGAALEALAKRPELQVTVVMGANAPALQSVLAQAASMPNSVKVLVNTPDMAALMAGADLAIGAAGGTAWERCALGLPSLIAVLADNQSRAAAALQASGAALSLGRPERSDFGARLADGLAQATCPMTLARMSRAAADVADGGGAPRVAAALEKPMRLRPAVMADAEAVWQWRRAVPRMHFRAGATPSLPDHLTWFARALADPARRLYAVEDPARAHLRLDLGADGAAAVSILLAPEARGKGLGLRLLMLLADAARAEGLAVLVAEVHLSNLASLALFRAAGYTEGGTCDEFVTFTLPLQPLQ
jgi:UDP-2,4-diacetamido-2,4,6-trideoxy-beta-L-altropyranose hydrolase